MGWTARARLFLPALAGAVVLACGSDAELQTSSSATSTPESSSSSPAYLALGDSLAVGVGATDWVAGGYVPLLHRELNRDRAPGDEYALINVGESGADTRSVIEDGQLSEAIAAIDARRATVETSDDVEVITVGIGGNDGFGLVAVCGDVIDERCLTSARDTIREVRKNLLFIIDSLRAAAGDDVRIVVMTYYNPLVHDACPLHDFEAIGDVVLEGDPDLGVASGLNDEIRAAAEVAAVPVAEVGPLSVPELTGDCLHASDAGHARIAAAFAAALNL